MLSGRLVHTTVDGQPRERVVRVSGGLVVLQGQVLVETDGDQIVLTARQGSLLR